MKITIRDVGKDYGAVRALDAVDLDVASGELLALLGPARPRCCVRSPGSK